MAAKDRIFNAVQARLGGATSDFIEAEYNDAVMEYFTRSTAWRHRQDITLKAGRTSYSLVIPNSTHVSQILMVGSTSEQLSMVPAFVEGMSGADLVWFDAPSTLRLKTAPSEDRTVTAILVLSPESGSAVPEYLLLQEYEGIKDLVLARMYAIPQRPWTSDKLAALHIRRAVRAIAEAQRVINRGYGGPNWAFPSFA